MIIVTGGAGFIGSNTVADLCDNNQEDIVVCDIFDTSLKWKNLSNKCLEDIVQPMPLLDNGIVINRSNIYSPDNHAIACSGVSLGCFL